MGKSIWVNTKTIVNYIEESIPIYVGEVKKQSTNSLTTYILVQWSTNELRTIRGETNAFTTNPYTRKNSVS